MKTKVFKPTYFVPNGFACMYLMSLLTYIAFTYILVFPIPFLHGPLRIDEWFFLASLILLWIYLTWAVYKCAIWLYEIYREFYIYRKEADEANAKNE